jgi:hypothetical protein
MRWGKARHHLPCLICSACASCRMTAGARGISRTWLAGLPGGCHARGRAGDQGPTIGLAACAPACSNASSPRRRRHSKLPALIDLRPRAAAGFQAGLIAAEPGIADRPAAQDLVAALGLLELTGRGRYRAWGIL